MRNTEVIIEVIPVGEKKSCYKLIIDGIHTIDDCEYLFDHRHPKNDIIENFRTDSKHGILENWKILKVEQTNFDSFDTPELLDSKLRTKEDIERHKHFEKVTAKFIKQYKPKIHEQKDLSDLVGTNWWVNPEAQAFKLGIACHNEWASEYLENTIGLEKMCRVSMDDGMCPYEQLQDIGWVRLLCWSDRTKEVCMGSIRNNKEKPNWHQKSFVNDWCMANGLPMYE